MDKMKSGVCFRADLTLVVDQLRLLLTVIPMLSCVLLVEIGRVSILYVTLPSQFLRMTWTHLDAFKLRLHLEHHS